MLPIETLAHIFEYLDDFDDLKSITLVCKQWLKATQIAKVLKNYKLTFSFVTVDSNTELSTLFANSDRVFSNIYFENAKFLYVDPDFWTNWMEFITEITFDYKFRTPDLPGGNFVELLKYTPRLKTLNVICSLGLFNSYFLELNPQDREMVLGNMRNVQELQVYFGEECLTKLEFGSWIDVMTHLKNIDFDVNSKRSSIPGQAYDEIFIFLEKFHTKVKGLHICDNNRALRRDILQRLFNIKDMKLKAFDVIINSASSRNFTDFLCTQSDLQYLTVNGSFSLNRSLQHLPKLKEIAMSNGPSLDVLTAFSNVEKLESLGIAGLEFYYEELADKTHRNYTHPKLKELYVIDAAIDFSPDFVERMCKCFANIRLLNLDGAMIDDSCLVHIFQLKKLQELKLSKTEITDRGFVGGVVSSQKRLKAENGLSIPVNESTVSISSLKELEVLNIDFCKQLSSHSFHSMQLKKLKHFSAQGTKFDGSHCQSLGENCPKIESLNLSKCNQLRGKDIKAIMSLKGLETLELESCGHIDMGCIKHIMRSNKLQTLNLTKCSVDVSTIAKEMFSSMKSLRRIILQKQRLYRCNYV